jgi:hypothetical protein
MHGGGDELNERPTYSGTTTIYGECLSVFPKCVTLRLHDGRTFGVSLATGLADALSDRVGETIGLDGKARWDAETNVLTAFHATEVTPYRDRDPGMDRPRTNLEALAALAEAANGRWDNVDPDEFVRELRRD